MPKRICSVDECCSPHRARGLCSTHYNLQNYTPAQRHQAYSVGCTVCGKPILRAAKSKRRPTCSVDCRSVLQHGDTRQREAYDWAQAAEARAQAAGAAIIQRIERDQVFERDGWMCLICDTAVARGVDAFDPDSATVDHVVPLSKGGVHTMANVQTAHLRCNSAKADRLVGHAA